MKKYKINTAYPVNTRASKNGIKWKYSGKKTVEEAQKLKDEFERISEEQIKQDMEAGYCIMMGLRITDTETNTVIYEKIIN